jgi:hypothetical protein
MSNEETIETTAEDGSTTETPVESTASIPTSISIQDVNVMATIIEATSQRGAIKAGEMQVVGTLYSKIIAFLSESGFERRKTEAAGTAEDAPAEAPAEEDNSGDTK